MSDKESNVSEVFRRAGISAIHFYRDGSRFPVPRAYEPLDTLFQLYLDNDYIALDAELEKCKRKKEELEIQMGQNPGSTALRREYFATLFRSTLTNSFLQTLFLRT